MLWVIYLMFYFKNFSTGMFVYLFLHGSYGIAWVWKDLCFPDESFKVKGTLGSLVVLSTFLSLYWCIPLPLAAGYGVSNPPLIRIILVIIIWLFIFLFLLKFVHHYFASIYFSKKSNKDVDIIL